MKFGPVPLDRAEGKILGHNLAGPDGRRALRKGRPLTSAQVDLLRGLGRKVVYVAELEPGDVDEDSAAKRIAESSSGKGLRLLGSATGRVNAVSTIRGLFRVDAERLSTLNSFDGITLATVNAHSTVHNGQAVATIKVIPYALPEEVVSEAEVVSRRPLIWVDALESRRVGFVLAGSPSMRERLLQGFAPLRERIELLGSEVVDTRYVTLEDEPGEVALAEAIQTQRDCGVQLIVMAGETAVMDRHDIAPRAIERAGGQVECVGAPVDPGNLLMLGYLEGLPILGAPGCARSRKTNVVDWVLPRLLVGDRLLRSDVIALGHGGLLEDVPERPLPRSHIV